MLSFFIIIINLSFFLFFLYNCGGEFNVKNKFEVITEN
jgi:hypothetical protein